MFSIECTPSTSPVTGNWCKPGYQVFRRSRAGRGLSAEFDCSKSIVESSECRARGGRASDLRICEKSGRLPRPGEGFTRNGDRMQPTGRASAEPNRLALRAERCGWFMPTSTFLVHQPLVRFVCPRQFERIRDRGLSLFHAGDDVRASDPVRLGEVGLATTARDGRGGNGRSRRCPRRARGLRAGCAPVPCGSML